MFAGYEPDAYTELLDVANLPAEQREPAFQTWLLQCWLADNSPPQNEDELARFDLDRLRRAFQHAYAAGDWRRMRPRTGANMVRVVLLLSMYSGVPHGVVTNRVKPIDEIGRLRHAWHVPSHHLVRAAGAALRAMCDSQGTTTAVPIWLHDGRNGHVVLLRSVDRAMRWFAYDETTWPRGLSMLSEGENAAGVAATPVFWPQVGQFVVQSDALQRVVAGLTGPLSMVGFYRRLVEKIDAEAENSVSWTLPEGWGDIELAHHVWLKATEGLLNRLGVDEGE